MLPLPPLFSLSPLSLTLSLSLSHSLSLSLSLFNNIYLGYYYRYLFLSVYSIGFLLLWLKKFVSLLSPFLLSKRLQEELLVFHMTPWKGIFRGTADLYSTHSGISSYFYYYSFFSFVINTLPFFLHISFPLCHYFLVSSLMHVSNLCLLFYLI